MAFSHGEEIHHGFPYTVLGKYSQTLEKWVTIRLALSDCGSSADPPWWSSCLEYILYISTALFSVSSGIRIKILHMCAIFMPYNPPVVVDPILTLFNSSSVLFDFLFSFHWRLKSYTEPHEIILASTWVSSISLLWHLIHWMNELLQSW